MVPVRPSCAPARLRPAPGLVFVLASLALLPFAARPALAVQDVFAPPGTEYVRIEILHRGMVDELKSLGLTPEERGEGCLYYRVTPSELTLLRARDFPVSVVSDEEYAPKRQGAGAGEADWTTYAQLTSELQELAATYPNLTELRSAGQSVQGRDIWALKITRNPAIEEVEPEVRFVGLHHGNEHMGTELNRRLVHLLLEKYNVDSTVTALVNSREIWIVPMMNPDGGEMSSRFNAHGVDLNRSYGYMWEGGTGGSSAFSEPETRAIRDLSTDNWFSVGISYHTTAAYVNSIWNYSPHYTEDDDLVWVMSLGYAGFSGYTPVRGWYWYETHGDCNDWSYGARSTLDWTVETANSDELGTWGLNKPGMLYVLDAAGWGIQGVITDAVSGAPLRARATVDGIRWPAFTDPALGDFHKPLLPGTYTLRVSANGYEDALVAGVVVTDGPATTVNVALVPGGGRYADRVEVANVADPNNNYANYTLTPDMLGAPDGVGASLGKGGSAITDFGPGSEARDIAGADLRVTESPEDPPGERYTLYAGNSYNGPWTSLGMGTGTTSFDLAGSGLAMARYLRIVDDGDGTASDPYAGFDLDAIESFGSQLTGVDALASGPGSRRPAGRTATSLFPPAPNPVRAGAGAGSTAAAATAMTGGAGDGVRLGFAQAAAGHVTITILDARGRRVATPLDATVAAGAHQCRWSCRDEAGTPVAPGLYLVRLESAEGTGTQKLVVVK